MATIRKGDVRRILREFKAVVRQAVSPRKDSYKNDPDYQWAAALPKDPDVLEALGKLLADGVDVGRLLMVGLLFRCGRESFVAAWSQVKFGPTNLGEIRRVNLEDILKHLDALEATWGDSLERLFPVPLVREACEQVHEANREVDENPDRVLRVRMPSGELKVIKPIPGSARATILQGESAKESAPALKRAEGSGRQPDAAENVLAVIVAGHLNSATGERRATIAARFIAVVLGAESPSSQKERAFLSFKNRVEVYWQDKVIRDRVRLLAGGIDLAVKFD